MHLSFQICESEFTPRQRQIQKSNEHVNNIIESVKKIIYQQKVLTNEQRQKLHIKISIQNDRLKRSFSKIDNRDSSLRVQVNQRTQQRMFGYEEQAIISQGQVLQDDHKYGSYRKNQFYSPYTYSKNHNQNYIRSNCSVRKAKAGQIYSPALNHSQNRKPNLSRNKQTNSPFLQAPQTKITISRMQNSPINQITIYESIKDSQSYLKDGYKMSYYTQQGGPHNLTGKIDFESEKIRNSRIIIQTGTINQPSKSALNQKQNYISNDRLIRQKSDRKSLNHQTIHQRGLNEAQKLSSAVKNTLQTGQNQQISIQTPIKHVVIVNKSSPNQNYKQISFSQLKSRTESSPVKKTSPKTEHLWRKLPQQLKPLKQTPFPHIISESYQGQQKPLTQKSFKDIITNNKSRLNSTTHRQQAHENSRRSDHMMRQNHQNQGFFTEQIENNKQKQYKLHIDDLIKKKQENKTRLYGKSSGSISPRSNNLTQSQYIEDLSRRYQIAASNANSTRNPSQNSRSKQKKSGSSTKNRPLHSKTIKNCNFPCGNSCTRCRPSSPKISKEELSSYHLVKKYLTAEGQNECYNFLRSQGIAQKDWPIFITEYVYRQLSKVYKQVTPTHSKFEHLQNSAQNSARNEMK